MIKLIKNSTMERRIKENFFKLDRNNFIKRKTRNPNETYSRHDNTKKTLARLHSITLECEADLREELTMKPNAKFRHVCAA